MQNAVCEQCQQSFSRNDLFIAFGRSLCESCANAALAERGSQKIPDGAVRRQVDPTICAGCGRDNGYAPLGVLGGGTPVCAECEARFRNPSFPRWIKVGFAGLIVLMVLSCLGNWRFFKAYVDMSRGVQSLKAQDLPSAAAYIGSASRLVPESAQIAGLAAFLQGMLLMSQDKSAEALEQLREAERKSPGAAGVGDLILQAEIGVAFDKKDYDGFLEKSKALEAKRPGDPAVVAGVASALACKWAASGDEVFRQQALERLDRARQMAGPGDATLKEYEARIHYRLDSREIIKLDEYRRRFPGGYVRNGEPR